MARRMLIDATHPEETRVAVVNGNRLEEFDYETEFRKQLKGNIYLAKVTRVEPSLQAAFVEYGGNRHAFLPFPEIHQDYYRIPVGDRPHQDYADGDETPGEESRAYQPDAVDNRDGPQGDDHDHDHDDTLGEAGDAGVEESLGRALPVSVVAADDVISEAFSRVEYEFGPGEGDTGNESAHEYAQQQDHGQPDGWIGEAEAAAPGDFPTDDETEGVSTEPAQVETVGGDEIEEMRHRRRAPLHHYKIQEVIKRRQIMLIQVSKEERGNKGAAVTTFLSLPGRYCVLMPNTPRGGGISRKIANPQDRKRMKDLIGDLDLPNGMSVILRTAGVERSKTEIKRDLDYLMRLWETIRDLTLRSTAPALVYEEGNLIKRAIRDIYDQDIDDILVAGDTGYRQAKDFMRMLMPSHARRVQVYRESVPLFFRFQVETQIDAIHSPMAQLRSGGYIVINQTEALVSIDVNSGRSTRERNIEETAYKTNLEAAEEIARQLRLRDMGGLIVIDFIDMEDSRHDSAVERRLKEAMKADRARIQIGRVSAFGLLELSRQRLHPSLIESNFHSCPTCEGTGLVRAPESAAFMALRAIEEEGIRAKAAEIIFHVPTGVALYILNHKRAALASIESRYGFNVAIGADDTLVTPAFRIERLRPQAPGFVPPIVMQPLPAYEPDPDDLADEEAAQREENGASESYAGSDEGGMPGPDGEPRRRRRRRRGRRRDGEHEMEGGAVENTEGVAPTDPEGDQPDFTYPAETVQVEVATGDQPAAGRRRRAPRGRRRSADRDDTPRDQPATEEGSGSSFGGLEHEHAGHGPDRHVPDGPIADRQADRANAGFSMPEPSPAEAEPQTPRHEYQSIEQAGSNQAGSNQAGSDQAGSGQAGQPDHISVETRHDYEVVNQSPDSPRQGWWKRLMQ